MITAIDQDVRSAGCAHLAKGDFLRVVGGHGRIIKNPALPREFRPMADRAEERSRSPRVGSVAARSAPTFRVAKGGPDPTVVGHSEGWGRLVFLWRATDLTGKPRHC